MSRPGDSGQSQWALVRKRFAKHRVAVISLNVLVALYLMALLAEFVAPYPTSFKDLDHIYQPPQPPGWSWSEGVSIPLTQRHVDPITYRSTYITDPAVRVPLGWFVEGEPYRLWGMIPASTHLFGVDVAAFRATHPELEVTPRWYLFGGDRFGQDIASRLIYGARVSLSIGMAAIVITFILGLAIGGFSGYLGGTADNLVQRGIEIINGFPQLPLWLALSALVPSHWPPLLIYLAITLVLALLSWTGLARVVRGRVLALREEDYTTAARLLGASHSRIIGIHLLPGVTSHVIVALTLAIPAMILGETALSFLGLGLRPPVISWGVMLQDCMDMQIVENYPWILLPVLAIVVTVLAFNFLGDGLRDAADPYAAK